MIRPSGLCHWYYPPPMVSWRDRRQTQHSRDRHGCFSCRNRSRHWFKERPTGTNGCLQYYQIMGGSSIFLSQFWERWHGIYLFRLGPFHYSKKGCSACQNAMSGIDFQLKVATKRTALCPVSIGSSPKNKTVWTPCDLLRPWYNLISLSLVIPYLYQMAK